MHSFDDWYPYHWVQELSEKLNEVFIRRYNGQAGKLRRQRRGKEEL